MLTWTIILIMYYVWKIANSGRSRKMFSEFEGYDKETEEGKEKITAVIIQVVVMLFFLVVEFIYLVNAIDNPGTPQIYTMAMLILLIFNFVLGGIWKKNKARTFRTFYNLACQLFSLWYFCLMFYVMVFCAA